MSRDVSPHAEARRSHTGAQPISLERKLELLEPRFTSSKVPANQGIEGSLSLAASPSASHHSFAFDPPAGSRSSTPSSGHSSASNLPASSVRSKRRSRKLNTSLHAVTVAAERQMRKVQAASPTFIFHDQERSISALASPPLSNASGSNSTLLTSHVNPNGNQPQVVAESPPTLMSPAAQQPPNEEKPKVARNVLGMVSPLYSICSVSCLNRASAFVHSN